MNLNTDLYKGEFVYRKESLIYVVNIGLTENLEIDLDFRTIKRELSRIYNAA